MAARLAVLHWVIRLVRRERRQHVLVIALLTFGIASSVVAVSTLVRLNTPIEREFAGAESVVSIQVTDPAAGASLPAALAEIVDAHPGLEVVAYSVEGPEGIRLVGQDPTQPLGQDWARLLDGRWPGQGEVTLSGRAIERLHAAGSSGNISTTVTIAGAPRTVVGHYENPSDLGDASAIVPVAEIGLWSDVKVLLPADAGPATSMFSALGNGSEGPNPFGIYQQDRATSTGSDSAMLGYVFGTVLCLQIAVLASAGFTVLANRRRRQLGLLAALGAEPATIGSVMTMTGLVVGVIGGILGLSAGIAIAIATTPLLQRVADFRLSTTVLGWAYLIPMVPLAVAMAVTAAWWPARRVRHVSAIDAITDRAGRRTGFARSLGLGAALLTSGSVTMKIAAPKNDAVLVIGSVIAIIVGALLLAPAAALLLGRLACNAPLPIRLAWRDIARNRARSAAAIAAAAIAVALPFGIATFTNSLATTWQPVVPTNVATIWSNEPPTGPTAATTVAPDDVRSIAAAVPGVRLIPSVGLIDTNLTEPDFTEPGFAASPYVVKTTRSNGDTIGLQTALATPELLEVMDVDPPPSGIDVIVWASGRIRTDPGLVVDQRAATMHRGFPEALVFTTPDGTTLDQTIVDRWYIVADQPFTELERDRLTLAATATGSAHLSLSDSPPPFVAVRAIALAFGGLFALPAVAVAVALIRTENTDDTRVLASVGARPRTTRSIAAATAAGLTLTAAVIAIIASFALLAGVYLNPDENFEFTVPWAELAAVLLVMPAVGAAAAWLLTSTRLEHLNRTV